MTRWNKDKNERLMQQRGVSFEELMAAEVLCARGNPGRHNQ